MSFLAEVNLPSPSDTPAVPAAASFFKLFGGFLAVAAVLVLCMWGLRVLSRRQMGQHKSAQLSVLSRAMLGRDSSVALIQVGSRVLAVGVTKENVSLLCEMPPEECACADGGMVREEQAVPEPGANASPVRGFWKRFVHNLGIASGLIKGKTPMRPQTQNSPAAASFADLLHQSRTATAKGSENPISGSQTAMESGGFSSAVLSEPPAAEPAPAVTAPVVPEPVSAVPLPLETETNRPEAGPQTIPTKTPMDYSAAVEQMKHRGRLEENEPPVVLQPARAVEAAYEKMAVVSAQTNTARAGVVYKPSAASPAAAPIPAAGSKTPKAQTPTSVSDDEMDRLMERVAARRDRLRRPEFGKEQA